MALVWNDTAGGQGLVQEMEDQCGLGRGGITGNSTLFQNFTRWANIWNKIGASYAIRAFDGHDFDDPNYTTAPTGTFTGLTTRDYNFDPTYNMLKIKQVNVTYDGTNYFPADPFDDNERRDLAVNDPNIDTNFTQYSPRYDLIANGFKLYPKFTAAQVSAGAKIYVEWFRTPREFATTGTDSYVTGFDTQFARLPAIGASYEYCKLYKTDIAASLKSDLYGYHGRYGASQPGMLQEMQDWYNSKSPSNARMKPKYEGTR